MTPIAIEANHLTRQLPLGGEIIPVLNDVSFEIAAGEWIALTGPSGSGKSTLLGLLAGIDTPSSGKLVIDGQDITQMPEQHLARLRNQKIGIVFQSFNLIPTLTAQENVEVPLYIHAKRREAAALAQEMLDLVGLSDRRRHRPHQLSGGQQQRVAIARALVTQPQILLADEPTGNLDSVNGEQVLALFQTLRQRLGLTIIVATHDPAIAQCADRVLHLHDGRLIKTGTH
ncbi:MAG: ABC transporter ATP-binding protein [Chloroflexi bacterium]|nr:ABC transporter ATP-binding protein [Chloroflexota bacterium]